MNTINWREYLIAQLAADKEEAFCYLETAIEMFREDGDVQVFLIALRNFIASQEESSDE